MTILLLVGAAALLVLLIGTFAVARRRRRSGRHNNWRNEAYLAREATGSWTENECAVGRSDAAPASIFPEIR